MKRQDKIISALKKNRQGFNNPSVWNRSECVCRNRSAGVVMLTWVVFCVVCEVNLISHCVKGTHTYTYIDRTVSLTIQHAASNQASIAINKSDDRISQCINKTVCFHSDSADSELSLSHWDRAGAKLTSFHTFPSKEKVLISKAGNY